MFFSEEVARRLRPGLMALVLILATAVSAPSAAAAEERLLVPVGHTVGIKLFSKGIVVAKLQEGESPARACGLREGDVILACGGRAVTSTEQFRALLQEQGQAATDLQIQRQEKQLRLPVEPARNQEGVYGIGAWVRDSMAGIGTMTYYDPATGEFGALGHGITDVDTALLMPFSNGSILPSSVKAVQRGERGQAGELRGSFELETCLGPLEANTEQGIFGILTGKRPGGMAVPTGRPAVGPAEILTNVEGDRVQRCAIQILKTDLRESQGKNMVLSIVDPDLLQKTGGIVQGMSGSPILQNGKLVGAVTHVFLKDPSKGYGISMDSMLKAAE